ncbi:hypothetical protein PMAYCL1PPCAC_17320 [Pristionchus mayeri]|uniref:Palmitoyl-protein thioesterase 1 n=1 Tax=Pristionchus mayeri TaxID=1317129 RepID=A0AAN5CMN3_9BILA|nr:hypothetical protein PMAYCL1PPCAC_17320 [Pristionchus mayeri]
MLPLLVLVASATALVAADPTPIVLWHGMGDTCCSVGSMGSLMNSIKKEIPGVYMYSVELGSNTLQDREKGFLANMNDEIEGICKKIAADPKLAGGFNAIGLSQGGQFLRAVAQRCPNPPMKNLVTLGGQHQGVYGFPHCAGDTPLCDEIRSLLDEGAYIDWIQNTIVQAQYFHDSDDEELYRTKSIFIAEINNELKQNDAYKENLSKLEQLILVKFTEDSMIVPRDSSWFGFYAEKDIDTIVPFNETKLYTEDRIGLRTLDQSGRLQFYTMEGDHLQIDMKVFNQILDKYFK